MQSRFVIAHLETGSTWDLFGPYVRGVKVERPDAGHRPSEGVEPWINDARGSARLIAGARFLASRRLEE